MFYHRWYNLSLNVKEISIKTNLTYKFKKRGVTMFKKAFPGGIDILDYKELSEDENIVELLPQGEIVFPMLQYKDEKTVPTVKKGDKVLVGQIIAEGIDPPLTNLISSVSGEVKAIEDRLIEDGNTIESVIIENDKAYTTIDGYGVTSNYKNLSKQEIRSKIKEAGIPSYMKLTPKKDEDVEYIIINGTECESYLNNDYRLMVEETEKLIEGTKIVLKLFDKAKAIIAINDKRTNLISKLEGLLANEEPIEVKPLKGKYPFGATRPLVYQITGHKLMSEMDPIEKGCIISGPETVVSIYNGVSLGIPLIEKVITISGEGIKEPANFKVKIGTSFSELVEAAGGLAEEANKIIYGGPMMGHASHSVDVPVSQESTGMTGLQEEIFSEGPCIRCGKCRQVCPVNLVPSKLKQYADVKDQDSFMKYHGIECCNCGSCAFICPSKISLVQSIQYMKKERGAYSE